jgi:hypothetical protein
MNPRDHSSSRDNFGWGPAITFFTVLVFFCVFATLHDIARESEYTGELVVLLLCVPAFAFLYRKALRLLTPRGIAAWLGGTGLVILLFDLAAFEAIRHPKYPNDVMAGSLFLAVSLPVLALACYHLARVRLHR